MEISKATRTHLIYQFIIVTLLFLGIGYNELLPDRKFILFLAFLPIFCYQLVILSCCVELMPVPSWMSFLQPASKERSTKEKKPEKDFESRSSPVMKSAMSSRTQTKNITFPEIPEVLPYTRRWEKSVTDLGASPKCFVYPQKSKSWMNLNDSRSSERLSSREGSLDTVVSATDRKCPSKMQVRGDKSRNREERAMKSKSWKAGATNFDVSEKSEFAKSTGFAVKERAELPSLSGTTDEQESELEKSYSFPFRQKRLQTWLEMKESTTGPSNQSPDIPYWQTVGYNLAVKYEARRRRRAISTPTKSDVPNEENPNLRKSVENVPESASDRSNPKKSSKSASACMNKIKVGFSNLISKKKEEGFENSNINSKVSRSSLFKLKNKSASYQTKEKEPVAMPQFLNKDRPLIFYPKYIPFEKERFESDVKKKMTELAEEQKTIFDN